MSLHDDIMNIPHAFDTYPFGRMERVSYVTGHRDARHAAAELAVEADTEIERLKAENAGLRAQIEAARPPLLPPIDPDDEEIVDNIFRRLDCTRRGEE